MFAHGERYDDAGSGPTGHPELEEIAALVDGKLAAPRAERLRSHLASCAECREMFFGTIDFVREEEGEGQGADPLPFDRPRDMTPPIAPRPSAARWLPSALAAAAVVAVGIGLAVHERSATPPRIDRVQLAYLLRSHEPALREHYGSSNRGPSSHGASALQFAPDSFRLGVAFVNLMVSRVAENWDEADTAVANINGANEGLLPPDNLSNRFKGLRDKRALRALTPRDIETLAERYRNEKLADLAYLDLGTWTEAGHLATIARQSDFLTSRNYRRFPSYIRDQVAKEDGKLDPTVAGSLSGIEKIVAKDRLTQKDYDDLGPLYQRILSVYAHPVESTD